MKLRYLQQRMTVKGGCALCKCADLQMWQQVKD